MKRIIGICFIIITALTIAGCSSSAKENDSLTMEKILEAYTSSGEEISTGADGVQGIDKENKPYFQMIGAEDGVMFYLGTSPVKIYEYKSSKELKDAQKEFGDNMKEWVVKGKFTLETSNEKAKEIFNLVE